ncbi:hypothetical protein DL93DRAFT_2058901 [Clavulina sp. PMI_390]|nr:hypothetical protein DL93DRAFT_2058901 [Clavulina sp. PMI_390]
MLQVNGNAGHQHEFYYWVSDSDWTGGDAYYSDLEEAGPYWFNAIVPTAFVSGSEVLINRTQYFLDYALDHQDPGGWIGPEIAAGRPTYLWARNLFMFGATQLIEADPTRLNRTLTALYKYVPLALTMLNNGTGLNDGGWGAIRWQELALNMQWLYDNYPMGHEQMLLDVMTAVRARGGDWASILAPENFPTSAVPSSNFQQKWHGVNTAEGLHAAAVAYRMTGNATGKFIHRAAIDQGWNIVFQYHGRPSGAFAADEFLAGLEAYRGTELCLVVELMFSGSLNFQVTSNTSYADHVEKLAFNALPSENTPDMWSHQYLQQQNQIASQNMNPNPFPGDDSYSNVFGLEPNYPCCTVNHPQGFPKYVSNAFVVTGDKSSLLQVYLAPLTVSTTLANNNLVTVTVTTHYPFSDTVTTTIVAKKGFTHQVRIPAWVVGGTIQVGSKAAVALSPKNGFQSVQVPAGGTTFTLNLPAQITLENRLHGAVAVHRGPLHYALMITHNDTQLPSNPAVFTAPEPRAADWQLEATSAWSYAIDPNSLHFVPASGASAAPTAALPSPIFADGVPPVKMTVLGCAISGWNLAANTSLGSPPENPACAGPSVNLTLVPYGATRLRISEFPTVKLV